MFGQTKYIVYEGCCPGRKFDKKSDPRQKCINNSDSCLIRDSKFVVSAVGKLEKNIPKSAAIA